GDDGNPDLPGTSAVFPRCTDVPLPLCIVARINSTWISFSVPHVTHAVSLQTSSALFRFGQRYPPRVSRHQAFYHIRRAFRVIKPFITTAALVFYRRRLHMRR